MVRQPYIYNRNPYDNVFMLKLVPGLNEFNEFWGCFLSISCFEAYRYTADLFDKQNIPQFSTVKHKKAQETFSTLHNF